MPKPVTEPRIVKLIELEASGRIKPEHQAELDSYRARGLAPKGNEAGSEQGKAGGFYRRAVGANADFANAKAPTPGLTQSVGAAVLPADVMNGLVGEERQLADQAQRDFIAATLRYESGAAIPPEEFESQRRIFFPVPGDGPKVIAQKSAARLRAIEGLKDAAGPAARGIDVGGAAKPAEQIAISKDGSGTFATEADKSFAQIAQAAFDKGANRAQLDALAVQYGYQRYNDDLDKAIAYRNSGKKGAIIAAPESGSKGPTILGTLAATPVGSGFAGAANALTGGYLDEIVGATGGDAEQAQAAKEVMRANSPIAYGAGEIGGAVLGSLGGGVAAARFAPSLGAGATSLIGDAAYGAIYGSGEQNDNRLGGALVGAGSAAAGGIVGQGLVRGASRVLSPDVAPSVRFLRDRGVRTTPGQSLGETASRFEEKLVSLPVVGDLIRSGRERALGDFNRGVMNDALSRVGAEIPEGVEGTAAMQMGQEAFDKAYDAARSNMSLTPDQQLADELADLSERVASGELSDASANRLATIYEAEISRRLRGGAVDGATYKRMSSRLGALQRSTRGSDPELSNALGEMQSIIDQAARRSSPPEAAAAMDAADEGYALWTRVENAARMRGGDTGKFTPSQLDAAVQRGDGSVRSRSYLRGDALGQEWAEAGKAILRDQVPNSGTADRLAAGGVLGGIAYAEPTAAIPMAALAGAYTPVVRDALSGAFAGARPEGVLTVAEALRRGIPVANALGSGAALASLPR